MRRMSYKVYAYVFCFLSYTILCTGCNEFIHHHVSLMHLVFVPGEVLEQCPYIIESDRVKQVLYKLIQKLTKEAKENVDQCSGPGGGTLPKRVRGCALRTSKI